MKLSKSRFCKGIQCPKMLWMDKHMPEQFDQSVLNETALTTGSTVGELAMGYFGPFTRVPFSKKLSEMLQETRCLLKANTEVVAEATFSHGGCICISDILRASPDGYELIEVKSSSFSACDDTSSVKPIYLFDMAFQAYVLSSCGIRLKSVSILQLNHDYIRQGELDINKLFILTDCSERVFCMAAGIKSEIAEIESVVKQEEEPDITIGSRCGNPYECGYKKWCFRNLPQHNVFDIGWGMRASKKDDAYNAGIVTFKEVLDNSLKLSEKQLRQVTVATHNLAPQINKEAISAFISKIYYPLCYLDFETYQQPIPLWDNVSPYEQIPFQYSLHIQKTPHSAPTHKEFLGKEGLDPRRALAEQLCADIPKNACVLAYNMSFEKGRIEKLAKLFPDLAEYLMCIHDQIIDLAIPFQSGAYYCKEMGGSYSIKVVLPALCPDDPQLDYNALNVIHNGSDAMEAYATLHNKPPDVVSEIRTALLDYCRLDTLAMVKILEVLYKAVDMSG